MIGDQMPEHGTKKQVNDEFEEMVMLISSFEAQNGFSFQSLTDPLSTSETHSPDRDFVGHRPHDHRGKDLRDVTSKKVRCRYVVNVFRSSVDAPAWELEAYVRYRDLGELKSYRRRYRRSLLVVADGDFYEVNPELDQL